MNHLLPIPPGPRDGYPLPMTIDAITTVVMAMSCIITTPQAWNNYIIWSTVPNLAFPSSPLQLLSLTVCAVSVISCGRRPGDEATSDLQPSAVQLESIHWSCLHNRGGWKLVISRTRKVANTVESL